MLRFSIKARCLVLALSPVLATTLLGIAAWRVGLLPNHRVNPLAAALLSSLVAAWFAAELSSKRISNRIRQMVRSTALIKAGMPIRDLDQSSDELGQLASSLAEMSTEVVRQKAEVIETSDRLEAIFRATRHIAILAEDTSGQIILCNPGAERLLGYAGGEMIGRPLRQIVHPEAQMESEPELRTALQEARLSAWQQSDQDLENVLIRKNGARVDIQLSIAPLKDMNGKAIGLLHVAHDITPRKVLESELRHRNGQLQPPKRNGAPASHYSEEISSEILPSYLRPKAGYESPDSDHAKTEIVKGDRWYGATAASLSAEARKLQKERVLVVDDFEATRILVRVQLADLDCQLDFAGDGEEALQKIAQNHYDLVLMDIEMPRMDGHETVRRIRTWEQQNGKAAIPVVAMTACSNLDQPGSNRSHWNSVLYKPLTRLQLLREVTAHLSDGKHAVTKH